MTGGTAIAEPRSRIHNCEYLRSSMTAGTAILDVELDWIVARVTAERAAQGLPPTVTDEATLAAVDDLLLNLPPARAGAA